MRASVVVVTALFSGALGCSKCGSTSTRDAAVAPAAPHQKHVTDLRTALTLIFPENRGARVRSTQASLTRTATGLPSVSALTDTSVKASGFVANTDGGVGWVRAPFLLTLNDGPTAQWHISLPIAEETIGTLYTVPNALSSMDLALWLPKDPRLTITSERFELVLSYEAASEHRASFLTRQLAELLLGNSQWEHSPFPEGWAPKPADGGFGEVPLQFDLSFTERVNHAVIEVHRDHARVDVHYTLVTDEGPP